MLLLYIMPFKTSLLSKSFSSWICVNMISKMTCKIHCLKQSSAILVALKRLLLISNEFEKAIFLVTSTDTKKSAKHKNG